uniref:Putative neuropeptide-like protein 31 n=1 Tax=Rhipicephalus microplus TaxID=6941 RepID=A0A6G5A4V3_RHIMP
MQYYDWRTARKLHYIRRTGSSDFFTSFTKPEFATMARLLVLCAFAAFVACAMASVQQQPVQTPSLSGGSSYGSGSYGGYGAGLGSYGSSGYGGYGSGGYGGFGSGLGSYGSGLGSLGLEAAATAAVASVVSASAVVATAAIGTPRW